jgi:hypothetical protein
VEIKNLTAWGNPETAPNVYRYPYYGGFFP